MALPEQISQLPAATVAQATDAAVLAGIIANDTKAHSFSFSVIRGAVNTISGVVGDGTTDNTAAIQAALTAARVAGGGWLNLQTPGTYGISAPLIIGSGTRFTLGSGVTIKKFNTATHETMIQNYKAGSTTTLSGGINGTATALTVASTVGYSTSKDIRIGDEWMDVTAISGTTPGTLTVTRGFHSSSTASHLTGAIVQTQLTGITRDTNIIVEGGTWDADNKNTDWYIMLFNNVDGVTVRDTKRMNSSKFTVLYNDVTNFHESNITLSTGSDGIHITGPASYFTVQNIYGETQDDFVSLTSSDWAGYSYTDGGNIHDGVIENLFPIGLVPRIFLLTGAIYSNKRIKVRNVVHALASITAMNIIDDSNTGPGGTTWDDITIENFASGTGTNYAGVGGTTGGTIVLKNVDLPLIVAGTITKMIIDGCTNSDLSQHYLDVGATSAGAYIKTLVVRDAVVKFHAGNTRAFLSTDGGAKIDALSMSGCTIDGCQNVFYLRGLGGNMIIQTDNCRFTNFTDFTIDPGGGTSGSNGRIINWLMTNLYFDVATSLFFLHNSGITHLRGNGVQGPASSGNNGWLDKEGGTLTASLPGFMCNANSLTASTPDDQCWNANVGGIGWAGPAIYSGGWIKNGWS